MKSLQIKKQAGGKAAAPEADREENKAERKHGGLFMHASAGLPLAHFI